MRGLASILFSNVPDESQLHTGLFIVSCSDLYAARMLESVSLSQPNVAWTLLSRYGGAGDVMNSSQYISFAQKLELLKTLRSRNFDLVTVAWTAEPSFLPLKMFAFLTGFRYLQAVTESGETILLVRPNLMRWLGHCLRRVSHRRPIGSTLARALSWIFLAPLGAVYVLGRAVWLSLLSVRHRGT